MTRPGQIRDTPPAEPAPATGGSSGAQPWALFHQNSEIWPAVMAEIEEARESLTIEQFIFSRQGIGRQMLDLLAARARAGVHVRVLADGFGSIGLSQSEGARKLRRAGGELRLYDSLGNIFRNPFGRLHRLHRKSVIRDGCSALVGGACYHDRMSDWRDSMVRVEGQLPHEVAEVFDALWQRATREDGRPKRLLPPPRRHGDWHYVTSTPVRPPDRQLYDTLLGHIAMAEREITLTTPYLVPDSRFIGALGARAGRGVRVRILMPERSDHRSLDLIGGRFAAMLARRGVEIWRYQPAMMHCKIALIDKSWAAVSSFNLDIVSFWMNFESGIATTDPAFCAAVTEQLERDLADCERL